MLITEVPTRLKILSNAGLPTDDNSCEQRLFPDGARLLTPSAIAGPITPPASRLASLITAALLRQGCRASLKG